MTGTAWYVARSRLRAEWRWLVALAVVAALGFGASMAALAIARRTADAHERVFEAVRSADYSSPHGPELSAAALDEALSGVDGIEYEQIIGFQAQVEGFDPADFQSFYGWNRHAGSLDRPFVSEGRIPTDVAPDEVFLNASAAKRTGLGVGDRIDVVLFDSTFRPARTIEVGIVGIGRSAGEFIDDPWADYPLVIFGPGFVEANWDLRVWGDVATRVLDDESLDDLVAAMGTLGLTFDQDASVATASAADAVRPLSVAVGATGVLGFVATAALLVQALLRRRQRHDAGDEAIRAVGGRVVDIRAAHALVMAGFGLLVVAGAAAVMVAASPLAPVGPFHEVDPARGVSVDVPVLAVGVGLILGVIALEAVLLRGRTAREPRARGSTRLAALPLPTTLGLRWTLDPTRRGRGSMLRSTFGIAAATGLVVTAVVFVGSLTALDRNPAWYGQGWDVFARVPYGEIEHSVAVEKVGSHPDVDGFVAARSVGGTLDGQPVRILGLDPSVGDVRQWPVVVSGRAPREPQEILVGEEDLSRLGLAVGDEVKLAAQNVQEAASPGVAPAPFAATIVGTAVFPNVGYAGIDPPRLGTGVAIAGEELHRRSGTRRADMLLVELKDGVDPDAFVAGFSESLAPPGFVSDWLADMEPIEVEQAAKAAPVIWATVAALALVAAGMYAHLLSATVQSRRKECGVLRALGLTGRQLGAAVRVLATCTYVAVVAVAMVFGVAAGRVVWTAFADELRVLPRPAAPPGALVLVAAIGALASRAIVAPFARRVRHLPAAVALRSE